MYIYGGVKWLKKEETMNEELNKKLAEWAGFKHGKYRKPVCNHTPRCDYHKDPKGKWIVDYPNFTQSLDACFKWLVPKLGHYSLWHGAVRDKMQPPMGEHNAEVWVGHYYGYGHSKESSALALCLAIEKLIDEDKASG